jgi:hypothetical protein
MTGLYIKGLGYVTGFTPAQGARLARLRAARLREEAETAGRETTRAWLLERALESDAEAERYDEKAAKR